MSLQSICVLDGKPVHIKPGSRREVLELAFHRKTQTVDVVMHLRQTQVRRPKPREDAASNTAARVSLPLTMSNIRGQLAKEQKNLDRLSAASVPSLFGRPRLR